MKSLIKGYKNIFLNGKFKFSSILNPDYIEKITEMKEELKKNPNNKTKEYLESNISKQILKMYEDSFIQVDNLVNLDLDEKIKYHYMNKRLPNNVDKLFSIGENNSTNIISSSIKEDEILTLVEKLTDEISKNPNLLQAIIEKFFSRNQEINKKIEKLSNDEVQKVIDSLISHVKDQIKNLNISKNTSRNSGFFKSLLNIYKSGYDVRNIDQIRKDNYLQFEEFKTYSKSKDSLTKEELLTIHMKIDIKMKELEELGKSKEQILYNENKGIPLKQDPFFQFLKINRKAREMLFQSKEVFSVESLINKALKQDIGPDPSIGVNQKRIKNNDTLDDDYQINEENKKFNSKYRDESLKDEDYYYKTNNKFKNFLLENYLCKFN